jgi:hypothetical protein
VFVGLKTCSTYGSFDFVLVTFAIAIGPLLLL